MSEQSLVLFDADRIRDFVFATGRLREIRGASALVRALTDSTAIVGLSELPAWGGGESGVIFANGGAGALLFPDHDRAEKFCQRLEASYREHTGGATLTAVAERVGGDEAAALRRAEWRLSRRKLDRPHAEAIPSGGPIRFCASDRLRPATALVPEPGTAGILVSEATALKRLQSRAYRKQLEEGDFWAALRRAADDPGRVDRLDFDEYQDLGTIGELARPRGYVAFVYVDGDMVGSLRRGVVEHHGLCGLRRLSETLQSSAEQATAEALAEAYALRTPRHWLSPAQGRREAPEPTAPPREPPQAGLPFELITIGGDDVVLICTAEHGLAVACALARRFGELVNGRLAEHGVAPGDGQRFTASAAVVIAHATMPITLLERRAYDLLRSAKSVKSDRQDVASGRQGVDFHVVTTPALDAISRVRERDYQPEEKVRLTARPYSLDTAERLLAYTRLLRGLCDREGRPRSLIGEDARSEGLPRSKAADLLEACQGPKAQATLDVLIAHSRLAAAERQALIEALHDLGSVANYPFALPRQSDGVAVTALPDLLELFEFVAEEGRWMRS